MMLTCCPLEWRWTIGAVYLQCSEAQFVGVAFDDCLSLHAGGRRAVGQCCASVQFAHKYIGADVIGADMHC